MIRNAFCQTNRLFNLLERAEKEICFSLANGTFKMKMDIDRHGPRPMPNRCKNLNPPNFSLLSTFKVTEERGRTGVGSGVGSISQRYGSGNPDPDPDTNQNVTDLQN